MTNEQFELILQRALAPEIDDSEIRVQNEESSFDNMKGTYNIPEEKARFDGMKAIVKITAVAACAALIVGAGIGGNAYLQRMKVNKINSSDIDISAVSNIIPQTENSFILKVGAEEITSTNDVPLIVKNEHNSYITGSGEGGDYEYCIPANFRCEGEDIESVTYSINKGAFSIVEYNEEGGSLIKSCIPYEGDFNIGSSCIVPVSWSNGSYEFDPMAIKTNYYTEYTLDYDSQQSDALLGVNICEEVNDEELFNKIFLSENTPEQEAEAYTETMEGVEITCTVHYTDGTTSCKTVVAECRAMTAEELGCNTASDDDPDGKIATFVYKLK